MNNFPVNLLHFQNGMVMAFDRNGQQIPEFQGTKEQVDAKFRELNIDPESVPYDFSPWPRIAK